MDINRASKEDLERTFQVDGTRAGYIMDWRNERGPFKSWEEVKQVPGFEDKMVENLREAGLTIGGTDERRREPSASGRNSDDRDSQEERRRGMDINTASAEDLERVFQIDGHRARYLIEARDRIGGFKSWDDVKREAPSFEDGMVENLKNAGAHIGAEVQQP